MLRRLTLENFMSHQHTVIDLADGLTVLTGPNNCGKSAVVAALQILASNGKTTHVMRHGAKECRITVETDDGHIICWKRKKASVSYTLDGEDIHRVGQGVPDGLHQLLKLPTVEADAGKAKVSYDIHFGEQKSPVFLLGDPGSRAASFFAAASDASRLLEMTVKHRSRVKESRITAKRLTSDIERCAAELTRLNPIVELESRLETAEQLYAAIERAAASSRRLQSLRAEIQRAAVKQKSLHTELQTLKRVTQPPELHDTPGMKLLMDGMLRSATAKRNAVATIDVCKSLQAPPAMEATQECRRQLQELTTTVVRCSQLRTQTAAYHRLQAPPQLDQTDTIQRQIKLLKQASQDSLIASRSATGLRSLQPPEPFHDTTALRRTLNDLVQQQQNMATATRTVKRLSRLTAPVEGDKTDSVRDTIRALTKLTEQTEESQRQLQASQVELSACEKSLRAFVDANPRCGVCGSELDPDRLLESVPGMEDHGHD